jgi:hypothetical protein
MASVFGSLMVLKQHLLAESADLVAAVFLLLPRMPNPHRPATEPVAVARAISCIRSS